MRHEQEVTLLLLKLSVKGVCPTVVEKKKRKKKTSYSVCTVEMLFCFDITYRIWDSPITQCRKCCVFGCGWGDLPISKAAVSCVTEQFRKVLIAGELIKYGQLLRGYIWQDI